MRKLVNLVWLVEAVLLVGFAVAAMLTPDLAIRVTRGWPVSFGWSTELLLVAAPFLFAWGLVHLVALLPANAWLARALSMRFALVDLALLATAFLGPARSYVHPSWSSFTEPWVLGGLVLVLLQLLFAVLRSPDPDAEVVLADASAVGPGSTGLWSIQGGFWLAAGLALLLVPPDLLGTVFGARTLDWSSYTPVLLAIVSMGLANLSWVAAGPQRVSKDGETPGWRAFAVAFVVWQGLHGAALLALAAPSDHPVVILLLGIVPLLLALAAWTLLLRRRALAEAGLRLRELAPMVWAVQAIVAVGAVAVGLGAPGRVGWVLAGGAGELGAFVRENASGVALVQYAAVLYFPVFVASIVGVQRYHQRIALAGTLTMWSATWSFLLLYEVTGAFGTATPTLGPLIGPALPLVILMGIPAAGVAFFSPPMVSDANHVDTRPPGLFATWVVQAVLFAVLGAGAVFAPEVILAGLRRVEAGAPAGAPWEVALVRSMGPELWLLAALSWFGARQVPPWVWRQLSMWFIVCFALMVVWLPTGVGDAGRGAVLRVQWLCAGALLYANLRFLLTPQPLHDLGLPARPTGALDRDLLPGVPMMVQSLQTWRRASHLYGVAATGSMTITAPPLSASGFPNNEWIEAHRRDLLRVRMRFANLTYRDDASLDVRGAALSIGEPTAHDRFDLVFNTGAFSPPANIVEFAQFVMSKWAPKSVEKAVLRDNRTFREGGVAGLRRAPPSYAELLYYSQIVRIWVGVPDARPIPAQAPDLVKEELRDARVLVGAHEQFLVRYRLVPLELVPRGPDGEPVPHCPTDSLGPEAGLPDEADAATMWKRERRPDERRAKDYLRRELRDRLLDPTRPVEWVLQAQFHRAEDPGVASGRALAWYDASTDWDERECPWWDLGRIRLTSALSEAETEVLRFNPAHCPSAMGIPMAAGLWDYRSLGDTEVRVMKGLARFRRFLYGVGGLPSEGR